MLKLTSRIEIESTQKWIINKIVSCEIIRDAYILVSTCKLVLPKNIKWNGSRTVPIQLGDKIKVYLGYDNNMEIAFEGYITKVGLKYPLTIDCEDEMYKLKTKEMDYTLLKGGIDNGDLLNTFTELPVRSVRFTINEYFRNSNNSVAGFLSYVKSFYPDCYFFRMLDGENTLICLNSFTPNINDVFPQHVYDDSINIISTEGLEVYNPIKNSTYVCIHVLAGENTKREKIERGVKDNANKKYIYHKWISDIEGANRIADYIIERENQTRLKGSFETFGGKLAWPFDIAAIKICGEKIGKYIIKKNVITFSNKGFRQQIFLDVKI